MTDEKSTLQQTRKGRITTSSTPKRRRGWKLGAAVALGLIAGGAGAVSPFLQADNSSAEDKAVVSTETTGRVGVALSERTGDGGFIDEKYQTEGSPENFGPFDVWDKPEGGKVIAWWYSSVGIRAVGEVVPREELLAARNRAQVRAGEPPAGEVTTVPAGK